MSEEPSCPYCKGEITQKVIGDEYYDYCIDCERIIEGMVNDNE